MYGNEPGNDHRYSPLGSKLTHYQTVRLRSVSNAGVVGLNHPFVAEPHELQQSSPDQV